MLRVTIQNLENYGAHSDADEHQDYWKFKFGGDVIVIGTDDRPANAMALTVDYLSKIPNGNMFRYYPINVEDVSEFEFLDNHDPERNSVMAIIWMHEKCTPQRVHTLTMGGHVGDDLFKAMMLMGESGCPECNETVFEKLQFA